MAYNAGSLLSRLRCLNRQVSPGGRAFVPTLGIPQSPSRRRPHSLVVFEFSKSGGAPTESARGENVPASTAGPGRMAQRACPIEAGRGAKNTEKRARRPSGRPNTPKTPILQKTPAAKDYHRTPKRGRPAPTGPAEHHSPQVSQRKERWETRPLVPTWHTPEQRGACETASARAAARNVGTTARGDASRASAARARAADAPRAPSTRGGTPRAGGGRRGS